MNEMSSFYNRFIEESNARLSRHIMLDQDFNKGCSKIYDTPVDITPKGLGDNHDFVPYKNPQTLNVYPSKADEEDYLKKAELQNGSIHRITNQVVFEIKGNIDNITCGFYGESNDLEIVSSAVRNYYPNSHLEIHKPKEYSGNFFVYTLFPRAPFYRSLSTYHDFFVVSPLNMIPQILLKLAKNQIGVYRVIIKPLGGHVHSLVSEAIDTEWTALQGEAGQNKVVPSLQGGIIGERLTYKSPEFRQYYCICVQLILPTEALTPMVKSFVSNFNYGQKEFTIYDNQHYSQEQVCEMLNKRVSYNTGFLVNSHELTSLLHIPYQVVSDKEFADIFKAVPAGDKPLLTSTFEDIRIGTWACGDSSKNIFLPIQVEIPHMHVIGKSRQGKSVSLSFIAINKFLRGESVFVLDPHGDLVTSILKMVPKKLIEKVVVIDFGLEDFTPLITIRGNVDLSDPSKVSDDMTEAMQDVGTTKDQGFWGPKMSYFFSNLYYCYCVIPELNLTHIRQLASPRSSKGKVLREKVKARIKHPIVSEFLQELSVTSPESIMPVLQRLSHLLLPDKSLRLFTIDENKINFKYMMENGFLCLTNLSVGVLGKQRSGTLSGLMDGLLNNNSLARVSIPYDERKPCTLIKDEFYLGPGDLDSQLTGLAKYGLSVVFAHQYLDQVEGSTREVMATAGSRLVFKTRRKDAEILAKDFNIDPEEITSLRKFQAFFHSEGETVKVNTAKPNFPKNDYSNQIMQNCLDKYYLKHDDEKKSISKKEILEFDKL
jgi:hypothetical protein